MGGGGLLLSHHPHCENLQEKWLRDLHPHIHQMVFRTALLEHGSTRVSAVLCLLVWRRYRAERCALSSGLAGIPGSALYVVFWSGGDTGLIVGRCLLVWREYRAQRCTLFSGLAGIPG